MNAREHAAFILSQVLDERRSLTAALEIGLADIPEPRDRALVQTLSYGVLRHYERLNALLSRLTRKPIRDPRIRHLALLGFYQLAHTRIPAHAAVSETVKACRQESWAKPLLNGLLRTYQRNRAALDPELDQNEVSRFSHPAWLIERLRADWPSLYQTVLEENHRHPPLTLRVNASRTSRSEYLERLRLAELEAHPVEGCEEAVTLGSPCGTEHIPGFSGGDVSIQDTAAQLAAGLLAPSRSERVLDLCAAPGGKSCHLLERCPDLEELVAVDHDAQRLNRIHSNLERLSLKATVLLGNAQNPEEWWDHRPFDRILLDAPCSATGVIRRHPDIKLHRTPADVDRLAETQLELLEKAFHLLKPGGILLYATCSILKQENEEVIAHFLQRQPEAKEQAIDLPFGIRGQHGLQILPGTHDMDGFFYARITRSRD